jgi:hypothetical protein
MRLRMAVRKQLHMVIIQPSVMLASFGMWRISCANVNVRTRAAPLSLIYVSAFSQNIFMIFCWLSKSAGTGLGSTGCFASRCRMRQNYSRFRRYARLLVPVPPKHGGADAPNNMQLQTREEAKAKDQVE